MNELFLGFGMVNMKLGMNLAVLGVFVRRLY